MKLFKRQKQDVPKRRQNEVRPTAEFDDAATFRRGRTLTGSVSSLIRSSNESQADLKSSRVHSHVLRKKRRHVTAFFVTTVCITAGLYVFISQFTAQATVQASPDSSLQLDTTYSDAIDEYLSDHMSQRLRMFTDVEQLTRHVQATAPEVESIQMRGSSGFGASLFEITFREPIASWDVNSQKLYVDATGVPFSRNYFSPPSLRITDESGLVATVSGQSIMSNRFMSYVGQVIGLAKEEGYTVDTIVIPESMTRQVEVYLDGVDYYFKFSSDRPAGEAVDDMTKTVEWMRGRQLTPEYVDVRVEGRVFYK